MAYDPTGRLQQPVATTSSGTTTTPFLYSGDKRVAEYVGGAVTNRYVQGSGTDEPLVWYPGSTTAVRNWLHADNQGSVIATSNGSGGVTTYQYGAYGEPNAWSGGRFRYTGQIMLPEVQLYYYKARVYDPIAGRFLQTDPIGYKDDLDLYEYVGDDPANNGDPTGLSSDDLSSKKPPPKPEPPKQPKKPKPPPYCLAFDRAGWKAKGGFVCRVLGQLSDARVV